jgi:hypothetical protein
LKGIKLHTSISTQSFSEMFSSGPGCCPLMKIISRSYPSGEPLPHVSSSLKCTVAANVLAVRERHVARKRDSIAVNKSIQQGLTEAKKSVSQYASHVFTLYVDFISTQPRLKLNSGVRHADTGTP